MRIYKASWHDQFHCLAGECPDTCCQGWEVPVDEETEAYYRTLPGELGEKLRAVMYEDADGDLCLQLDGDRCPMLDEHGLCRIMAQLGEEHVTETCRSHPRFCHEYGSHREQGLCASCPACAQLVLEKDLSYQIEETDELGEEETPELLEEQLESREVAFRILRRRELSLEKRLCDLLLFALHQDLAWMEGEGLTVEEPGEIGLPEAVTPAEARGAMAILVGRLLDMEQLKPDWAALLRQGLEAWDGTVLATPSLLGERAACYFVHRQWLRSVWEGQTLPWAEFAVLGVVTASLLAPQLGWEEAFRRFCQEMEHSEDNMDAMVDLCEEVPLEQLLRVLV